MQHNMLWVCVVNTSNSSSSDLRIIRALLMCIFNEYTTHGQCNTIWCTWHAYGFMCEWHVNVSLSFCSSSIALFDVQQRWCGKRVMKYRPHSIIICVLNFGVCAWAVAAAAAVVAVLYFYFSVLLLQSFYYYWMRHVMRAQYSNQ